MVARYKKKRLAEEMSHDSPPRHLKLEGSNRGESKRIVRLEQQAYDELAEILKDEAFDEEVKAANECYMKELTIPGYKCTCFDKKEK